MVDQGFQQVSEAAAVGKANPGAAPEELALEVPIQEEGFLYTYLSNGPSASSSLVYFDDFTVEQRSYIVAVHDYYPFGADFDQQSVVGVANKYRYQGKELQAELGLALYDFHARQYDPLLGRMTSVDPLAASFDGMSPYAGMGNNPISYVDPDGQAIHLGLALIGGAALGGGAGYLYGKSQGYSGQQMFNSIAGGALLGAGVAAGIHTGFFGKLGSGAGNVLANAPGASVELAQQVFSGVGPTVGADAALQMLSNNGPPTNNINRFSGDRPAWDPVTNQRISELNGTIRNRATEFINQVEQQTGIQLRVSQGLRTIEQQNALYAQGRTVPGNIVTNARGGESYHNYGLAFDVVEMVDGTTPNWNTTLENWNRISDVGQDLGLEWGGNWTRFVDRPHFQRTSGLSIRQLQRMYGVRINIR